MFKNFLRNRKAKIISLIILVSLMITGIIIWKSNSQNQNDVVSKDVWSVNAEADNTGQTLTPLNSNEYKNEAHRFSFRYPSDMKVGNFTDDNGNEVVLVQNADVGRGFQILISKFDEPGETLSKERIQQDIPDLVIKDEQPVVLGNVGEGLAFLSDNQNFGGDSREVWFVLNGYLYQVSTYAHLDSMLKSVLATWKFE